jgi:hypothetical protein
VARPARKLGEGVVSGVRLGLPVLQAVQKEAERLLLSPQAIVRLAVLDYLDIDGDGTPREGTRG